MTKRISPIFLTLGCLHLPCVALYTASQIVPGKNNNPVRLTVLKMQFVTGDTCIGDVYFSGFFFNWLNHCVAN